MYYSGKYRFMEEEIADILATKTLLTSQEVKDYIKLLQKTYKTYQTLMEQRDKVRELSRKLGIKRIYRTSYENTNRWDILNKYEEDIEEI